jgi:hypothetical protein
VTLEYYAKDLQRARVSNLVIGAYCDYDPWGLQIAEQMDAKMRFLGFKSVITYRLTTIDLFTETQIAKGKDLSDVPPKQKAIVDRWMEKTGGAHGKPTSVHIDVMSRTDKERLAKKFRNGTTNDNLDDLFPRVEPVDLVTVYRLC